MFSLRIYVKFFLKHNAHAIAGTYAYAGTFPENFQTKSQGIQPTNFEKIVKNFL